MTTGQNSVVSTAKHTKGFSLTIYNQNFAVVREQRQISLAQGVNFVRYEDVSAQIDPTSISIKSSTAPDTIAVREQNYQYDLLNPSSILNKSVGKTLRIRRVNPDGQVEILEGTLLNSPAQVTHQVLGLVIRLQDGRIVLNPSGEIELNEMPEGLVSRPSLFWKLEVSQPGEHTTEISYLTNSITWKADYIAVVNQTETRVDVIAWVTLDNRSGATYKDAQLQLIAGDVRRAEEPTARAIFAEASLPLGRQTQRASQFEQEAFFEYHLYTLQGNTTVRDNETKQITLLSATDVQVKRKLVFDSGRQWHNRYGNYPEQGGDTRHGKVNIVLELKNSQENKLGMPLPKGKVRVYKADDHGKLQFLGEELIDHTPRNETARFYIGDSFDVVGERKCLQDRQIGSNVSEQTLEIAIRNRKNNSTDVFIVERFQSDWEFLQSSHTYNNLDARTVEFPITIEADSEVKITYKVRIIR